MTRSWLLLSALLLATPSGAFAQGAKAAPAGEPKRDPQGFKGISPFWEALNKGDRAYVARDFDAAIASYRDAVTKEPQNPLGHYRMGEAHLAKGDSKEAEASWVAGLRFVGKNHTLRGKLLFVLADLREREKQYDQAAQGWSDYAQLARQQKEAKAYPGTAAERKKRIETWKKLLVDYTDVKKRIEKRLQEADEAARKSAK
jgi:tetratricopeptide (TPR) repeat protein